MVRRFEDVVLRIVGVKVHEREDVLRVDDALAVVDERRVMRAERLQPERLQEHLVLHEPARIAPRSPAGAVQILVELARLRPVVDGGKGFCVRDSRPEDSPVFGGCQ